MCAYVCSASAPAGEAIAPDAIAAPCGMRARARVLISDCSNAIPRSRTQKVRGLASPAVPGEVARGLVGFLRCVGGLVGSCGAGL